MNSLIKLALISIIFYTGFTIGETNLLITNMTQTPILTATPKATPTPTPKKNKTNLLKDKNPTTSKSKPPSSASKLPRSQTPPANQPQSEPQREDVADILYPDEFAEKVSSAVIGLANRIDSFFGTDRSDDEKNGSTLRIVPSYTLFEHKKGVSELGINLNLKLLNLETKAKKLEQSIREEFIETPKKANEKLNNKKMEKEKQESWHYNFESKLASRPALYYSGKLRARKNFTGSVLLHHFSFSAGWDTDDQWSQKTSLFSDSAMNETLLFRFSNEANWFLTRKLFQTTHGPSLIHSINKYNSVSYNWRLIFQNEKNSVQHIITSYSINYRHGTPSQRIFIDLIPVYSYSKDENFNESKSFEIRLEYLFGDL